MWLRLAHWQPGKMLGWGILAAACLWALAALLLTAWVCDDAYISFRVVDNFVQGYGLRWNVNERVQAYTHPLWLLLHIPFYFLWRNIYLITILLSLICSMSAVAVAARSFAKSPITVVFCLIAPLLLARPWLDYTSSGLENPLSYLLFAWFGWALLHARKERQWFWWSVMAALAMLNRLDMALIYAPLLLWLLWQERPVRWRQLALGFLPLALWLAFSLFYYGFLFPNTKYAKLNTGIAAVEYWRQGGHYIADLWAYHHAAAALLLAGIGAGIWRGWRWRQDRNRQDGILCSVMLGMVAYSVYIVAVGGDFMSGRFFSVPIFMAGWILYALAPARLPLAYGVALIAILAALHLADDKDRGWHHRFGIADERAFYRSGNALIRGDYSIRTEPQWWWIKIGKEWHAHPPDLPPVMYNAGLPGFYAGPQVTAIDELGLADPLLARLPVANPHHWRIGHFRRAIPAGYPYALQTGSTERTNPDLARYYEKLRLITAGDLWSWQRIETIAAFNLGAYDHWKEAYLKEALK